MIDWLRKHYVPIDAAGIIIAAILTAFAVGVAYVQFTTQWQLENEAQAKAAYREFLKISMDNPKYARPDLLGREYTALEYEQYFWYANLMSQTFEQVFQFVPDAEAWTSIAREQVRLHCGFYQGGDFIPEQYSPRFVGVVRDVLDQIPPDQCYKVSFQPGPSQ